MRRVFLIAGEASGDALGAALMQGLKSLCPEGIKFTGVGGELMQAEGLNSLFPMRELSVMGIAEVLPKYRVLMRRINQCADQIVADKPDVLITIDSPDFSLRVARRVKERSDIRTVHYVAPTVWAWRSGRAKKMAPIIDQVLALLPFEPPYMQAEGMRCDFVGHPIVAAPTVTDQDAADFRARHGIAGDERLLLVLPGSRQGEVSRLCPIFGDTVARLAKTHPDLRIVLPAAPAVTDEVRRLTANWAIAPVLIDTAADGGMDEKRAAFRAADLALAASGTVSLELAAAETPMVVAYDMNWISFQIIKAMAKIDTVTLVNIITGQKVVPEYLGNACKPDAIATALTALMDDPAAIARQKQAARDVMAQLGAGGEAPGLRAARAVLDGLNA